MPKVIKVPEDKPPVVKTAAQVTIKSIKIQSLISAHLMYSGRESGKQYEWTRAGAIVDVDETDVPELLSKRLGGKTCCGSGDGNVIFEKVVGD